MKTEDLFTEEDFDEMKGMTDAIESVLSDFKNVNLASPTARNLLARKIIARLLVTLGDLPMDADKLSFTNEN